LLLLKEQDFIQEKARQLVKNKKFWEELITVRAKVTLRLAIYHQSVRLGAKPLQAHEQSFFCN
jgi:hypothetical protein